MKRKSHDSRGYTVVAYLPPDAPKEVVDAFLTRVAGIAEEIQREGWDPFVFMHEGDVLQVDKRCECCPPHVYLSTSCFHGDHNYCKRETGLIGTKIPGVCKFCKAPCICECHRETTETALAGGMITPSASKVTTEVKQGEYSTTGRLRGGEHHPAVVVADGCG